ncbi:MAG: copper chaperone PCu(A)C [Acidimicrobiales bacterium]
MRPFVGVAVATLLFAGCGDDTGPADTAGALSVRDVWARPTAPGAPTAAFYFAVENTGTQADRLLGATSSACLSTMVHRSTVDDGVTSMEPTSAEELTLEPQGRLAFEPGGLHVMCLGLVTPLTEGADIDLRLTFEMAGGVDVTAAVEDR